MGDRPLVIVPVVYASYVQYRMARAYLDRFQSLAREPGVSVVDLLPAYRSCGTDPVRCFFEPHDCHFSPQGHQVLAEAVQAELRRLGLLDKP